MKIVKIILLVLVIAIAAVVVGTLMQPDDYSVERHVEINAPAMVIFENVANLNNWDKWDPWTEMEPDAKNSVTGSGEGMVRTWEGEEIGAGSLTLTKVVPGKAIETHLQFTAPMESESWGWWKFEQADGKTKVSWGNKGNMDDFMTKFFSFTMNFEKMIASQFDQGLVNLKKLSEGK